METDEVKPESGDSISTTWLLIYTATTLFVIHQLYVLTHFWRLGIPGPLPLPLIGNLLSVMGRKGFLASMDKWSKKYGKYYGLNLGSMHILMTSDPDLARLILIKDFPSFQKRDDQKFKFPYLSDSPLMAEGEPWKRGRGYMSPAFSGSKMKQMIPAINSQCDALMEVLDKKYRSGESFETKQNGTKFANGADTLEIFGSYVLDCVACCAFGIEADCQRNVDDPFLKNSKKIFNISLKSPAFLLRMLAPFLSPVLDYFGIDIFPRESLGFFADIVKQALELRKESGGSERKDFLQLMIDAAESGEENGQEQEKSDDTDEHMANELSKKKIPLTSKELMGQSIVFFFAGYETVSTTMSFMVYVLATNPEVQKKLQEEIDVMVPEDKPVGYDTVFKMEYLDKVWCESMRILPMVPVLKRICCKDFSYDGLKIPAGHHTHIDVWRIHHNPEYWPDPGKFDPERFSKEAKESRHPCAYMPFGAGPRNCVGMRFAILESKVALIRMLQKYSFELTPETPDLSDVSNLGKTNVYPKEGIHVRLMPRD